MQRTNNKQYLNMALFIVIYLEEDDPPRCYYVT
jgi:hypothetical protein